MAVDTADKRGSAIFVGLGWRNVFPVPDGTVATGDRQQMAWMYRGILPGALVAPVGNRIFGVIRGYTNTR